MNDHDGQLFHHHEGWVLDDGSQVDTLPASLGEVFGGGSGNSQAEKPWVIHLQPYLHGRMAAFCPSDPTPRSKVLPLDLDAYHGGITGPEDEPPSGSELAIAPEEGWTMQSYLLNSIFAHKSARYALERVLPGFAPEAVVAALPDPNLILFSERNSEALNAAENSEFGKVGRDDFDTWVGEAALVRWGSGSFGGQGWIRYNRHGARANYVYTRVMPRPCPGAGRARINFPTTLSANHWPIRRHEVVPSLLGRLQGCGRSWPPGAEACSTTGRMVSSAGDVAAHGVTWTSARSRSEFAPS